MLPLRAFGQTSSIHPVILSGAGVGWEAKDLQLRECR